MLRYKSEAEEALEALIRYYKKEGILIKKIRTDQGGEFGGHNEGPSDAGGTAPLPTEDGPAPHVFKRVCAENGITHELIPAKRPELHGLAERWNLTGAKDGELDAFCSSSMSFAMARSDRTCKYVAKSSPASRPWIFHTLRTVLQSSP